MWQWFLGMKSHTTRLIDEERGLAMTPAEEKAVAKARRFARACGLERELWVSRGEACGTLALGHVLDVLDEQGTPMRVVTSISVGNDKTSPKISHHRVDKFPGEMAKLLGLYKRDSVTFPLQRASFHPILRKDGHKS
jgi:hypothetical protein